MDQLTRLVMMVMITLTASLGMASGAVTTVSLHATVRLAPDQAVTIGAIADIQGPESVVLETIAIGEEPVPANGWTRLDADAVRKAIEASDARSGSVVVVGPGVSMTRLTERPADDAAPGPTKQSDPAPGVVTVRDHLRSWLHARYNAGADDLRASFDERDDDMLNTPTQGRAVEVGEIGLSGRAALRVTVYEGDAIVRSGTVRVGVEVRRDALAAVVPIRRGARVEPALVERRAVWADPTEPPADPDNALGRVLRRTVEPGEILRPGHLEAATVVHRGQDVTVRTVRGSVVVTSTARARHDACEGELVELESKNRPDRRFTARVVGPGRAVMVGNQETPP